jgi:hypothetical protein
VLAHRAHRFAFDLMLINASLSRSSLHAMDRLKPECHHCKILKQLAITLTAASPRASH